MNPSPRKLAILVALVGDSTITSRLPPALPATSVLVPDSCRPRTFSTHSRCRACRSPQVLNRRQRAHSTTEVQPSPRPTGPWPAEAPVPWPSCPPIGCDFAHLLCTSPSPDSACRCNTWIVLILGQYGGEDFVRGEEAVPLTGSVVELVDGGRD